MGSRGFWLAFFSDGGAGEEANAQPPVEMVFLNPIARGGAALGPALRPRRFEGVGQPPEEAEDRGGIRLPHLALIFPVGDVQRIMGAGLNAPAALFPA